MMQRSPRALGWVAIVGFAAALAGGGCGSSVGDTSAGAGGAGGGTPTGGASGASVTSTAASSSSTMSSSSTGAGGAECPGGGPSFVVLDHAYPSFGPPGCSGDDTLKLRLSAEQVSPSAIRFYVIKEDDTAWGADATLSVYVGTGPICPDPINLVKGTTPVVVGATEQSLEVPVEPYDGVWELDDEKVFWVGKDEGPYQSWRATDVVTIARRCEP